MSDPDQKLCPLCVGAFTRLAEERQIADELAAAFRPFGTRSTLGSGRVTTYGSLKVTTKDLDRVNDALDRWSILRRRQERERTEIRPADVARELRAMVLQAAHDRLDRASGRMSHAEYRDLRLRDYEKNPESSRHAFNSERTAELDAAVAAETPLTQPGGDSGPR